LLRLERNHLVIALCRTGTSPSVRSPQSDLPPYGVSDICKHRSNDGELGKQFTFAMNQPFSLALFSALRQKVCNELSSNSAERANPG
jgi:hypothetical protein